MCPLYPYPDYTIIHEAFNQMLMSDYDSYTILTADFYTRKDQRIVKYVA